MPTQERKTLPPDECVRGYMISNSQLDDFSLNVLTVDRDPPHAHRQLEPVRTRAPRIQIKHAAARLLLRNVAVAGDHYTESRSLRLQIKLRQIVEHINCDACKLNDFRLRQVARPGALVDIAADGRHWRDSRELLKNFRCANVARVNDVFGSA